ncbi:MAG: glycogen synthase GlgA [Deltaproteobacteria bacterium]|nr:glycogen synthase GlgA [Candidatus Zymogenaceae bacterium]
MRIVIVSPEAVPFAKTGGLADVAGALPGELAELGHEVRLVMPLYRMVRDRGFAPPAIDKTVRILVGERTVEGSIHVMESPNPDGRFTTIFIGNSEFFDREGLYGIKGEDFPDNASRFVFFSRAVLEALKAVDFIPDIIHVNDWQSGLIPLYLKSVYDLDPHYRRTSSVLTIHNLGYQGLFWHLDMPLVGVGWDYFTPEGIEFYGKISFLKAGMVTADVINTVSETYAEEIQTPEQGFGMDGILRSRTRDLFGILNGIDVNEWNPETDTYIPKNYSADDLSGKSENKRALLSEFYLPENMDVPLIGIISRLADQKGFDILADALEQIMELNVMMVILGTGDRRYHDLMTDMGKRYPMKMGVKLAYDNRLAHLIEAGADMFLMPSRYEPCGLNQMMSMRYGTVPVVRATGGLKDTVIGYSEKKETGTGISFGPYTPEELFGAVKKAVDLFGKPDHWNRIIRNGMSADFSWRASAKKYENLYHRALKKRVDEGA